MIDGKNMEGMNNKKQVKNVWVPINRGIYWRPDQILTQIFSSVDRASIYNLVNETNVVHDILSVFRQFYL